MLLNGVITTFCEIRNLMTDKKKKKKKKKKTKKNEKKNVSGPQPHHLTECFRLAHISNTPSKPIRLAQMMRLAQMARVQCVFEECKN